MLDLRDRHGGPPHALPPDERSPISYRSGVWSGVCRSLLIAVYLFLVPLLDLPHLSQAYVGP
eukprot:11419236-Alexandrium_andersonii.AAC.1